jgi:PhoPQ-activated pathogenicity-related protein
VDRPVWTHWLTVIKPDRVEHDTAMLYIGAGNNNNPAPERVSGRSADLALATGSVVADLGMVPNQPLHFADSKNHGRYEDDLIAYSRVKFIVTGDEEWLVRLAMVKSAVRAMDAIQQFMASPAGGEHAIEEFVVAGGSKRGWTTWLTGVVDERVSAIIPLVIDALNTEAITRHHFAAYGFFSTALGDYVRHGLYPGIFGTPAFEEILRIEDPFEYRDRERLSIPKYVINASGDQYFLPDNSQFYFQQMPDEKHLRYVPNAKHNLEGSDARESMLAYYRAILEGRSRPDFDWTIQDRSRIVVDVKDKPVAVNLWQASNPEARDFRLDVIGPAWMSTPLTEEFPNRYIAAVPEPENGYTAFFVELVYDSGHDEPFKFTTDVLVVPDVLPYTLTKDTVIELK